MKYGEVVDACSRKLFDDGSSVMYFGRVGNHRLDFDFTYIYILYTHNSCLNIDAGVVFKCFEDTLSFIFQT